MAKLICYVKGFLSGGAFELGEGMYSEGILE